MLVEEEGSNERSCLLQLNYVRLQQREESPALHPRQPRRGRADCGGGALAVYGHPTGLHQHAGVQAGEWVDWGRW